MPTVTLFRDPKRRWFMRPTSFAGPLSLESETYGENTMILLTGATGFSRFLHSERIRARASAPTDLGEE